MSAYTDEQIEYLRTISTKRTNKEITEMFNKKFNQNRTGTAIKEVRRRNKIRIRDRKFNENSLFAKNRVRTQFRKGKEPPNKKPIGHILEPKSDYKKIKVNDTGDQSKDWKKLHTFKWEKENGKVPENHVVIFLDSDKSNTEISNLTIVHRRVLARMNRNNYFSSDPEMTMLGIAMCELRDKLIEHEYMHNDRKLYTEKSLEAEANGIKKEVFFNRLKAGWNINDAATMKVANRGG